MFILIIYNAPKLMRRFPPSFCQVSYEIQDTKKKDLNHVSFQIDMHVSKIDVRIKRMVLVQSVDFP